MASADRVLIGVVTYAKDEHALPFLLESLAAFTDGGWDLFVVDTTPEEGYAQRLRSAISAALPTHQLELLRCPPATPGQSAIATITAARVLIQERFLSGAWSHLLFLDSDMTFPTDTIARLLSHNASVVSGVTLSNIALRRGDTVTTKVLPVGWLHSPKGPQYCRPLRISDVLGDATIRLSLAGFGCVLLRRDAFLHARIGDAAGMRGEDVAFFRALDSAGVPILMDTRVKCHHRKYPEGDRRTELLKPENWQKLDAMQSRRG